MKRKKKILALFMSIILFITSTPFPVDAQDRDSLIPIDITNRTDMIAIDTTDWWYEKDNHTQEAVYTDMQNSKLNLTDAVYLLKEGTENVKVGFTLKYTALQENAIHQGDFFTIQLPNVFENIQIITPNDNSVSWFYAENNTDTLQYDTTNINIVFQNDFYEQGKQESLHIDMMLGEEAMTSRDVVMQLQKNLSLGTEVAYELQFGNTIAQNVQPMLVTGDADEEVRADAEGTELIPIRATETTVGDKIQFHGRLVYQDDNWVTLVHPAVFDGEVKVVANLIDGTQKAFYAQDESISGDFYLMFSHDGAGAGELTLANMPIKMALR